MTATFTLELNTPLNARQAVVGKFDGKNPCLAVGTSGGKVVIHDAHDATSDPVRFLNINRPPTALAVSAAGGGAKETLYVGSETAVQAYNVADNTDVFYKDVGDGVNAMVHGTPGSLEMPVIVVGGNCSVLGFDNEGEEKYWAITGDNVRAMELLPWSGKDNLHALLVGSDDLEIRVLNNSELVHQMTETAPAVQLVKCVHPGRFIYALSNGTVGVYDKQSRAWRTKSKHRIESVAACDVDFDGVAEVLCGWSNGRFEVRSDAGQRNGDASYKDKLGSAVTNVLAADYRGEGRPNPLVCSYDGECRGYVAVETAQEEVLEDHDQKILEGLMQEKQTLQFEMNQFQKQIEAKLQQAQQGGPGPMPAVETKVTCKLRPNAEAKAIELVLNVNGGAVIQGATVSAEIVFGEAESLFIMSDNPKDTLVGAFNLEKDIAADLKLSVMVGFPGADCFQCHDMTVKLPKFAMYVPVRTFARPPKGAVTARVNERVNRLVMWAQSAFNGFQPPEEKPTSFAARFVSLRDGSHLMVEMAADNGGELLIHADTVEVAGEVVADLGQYLGVTELATTAEFPEEFAKYQELLSKVDEYNAVRMKLTGEMADSSQFVKALVVKAEDARIVADMSQMKKMYGTLYETNHELFGEFMKRSNNHADLVAALKAVNTMIQKAERLRIGPPGTKVTTECRNAVRNGTLSKIVNIIRTGTA